MHQLLKFIFGIKLHVSDSSSVHHQEFFSVHTENLYDIYYCCVYSEKLLMMYRGTVRSM